MYNLTYLKFRCKKCKELFIGSVKRKLCDNCRRRPTIKDKFGPIAPSYESRIKNRFTKKEFAFLFDQKGKFGPIAPSYKARIKNRLTKKEFAFLFDQEARLSKLSQNNTCWCNLTSSSWGIQIIENTLQNG